MTTELGEGSSKYPLASSVIGAIETYYTPALVAFGALGNCLSVYVVFASKMRRTSSSFYLAALALSDTGFLMSLMATYYDNLLNQQGFCQFLIYLSNVCSFLSSWFVVAFTVERFVAVCYPLRRQWMCTVNRAKILVSAITLVGLVNCCPVLLYLRIRLDRVSGKEVCGIAEGWDVVASVVNNLDTFLTFALPLTLIVILNSLIVKAVWHVDSVRTSLKARASTRDSPPTVHQVRVTKMLLIVSSVFCCLNLPAYAMRVYAFVQSHPTELDALIQRAFNILFNTNFGISFGLYCASGQNFRSAVVQLFHCHRSRRRQLRLGRLSKRSFTNQTNQPGTDTIRISGSTMGEQTIMYGRGWKDSYQLRTFGSQGMTSSGMPHQSTDFTDIEDCYSSVDFSEPHGWKNECILEE